MNESTKDKRIIVVTIIAIILIIILRIFAFTLIEVEGESMNPTFEDNDIALVYKLSYLNKEPKEGDIILAEEPTKGTLVIKRIVGIPGDTISSENKSYTLKGGEYFIRGDNKGHSRDSDTYGPVKRESIKGEVLVRFLNYPKIIVDYKFS